MTDTRAPLELVRGDRCELVLVDLLDKDDAPAEFTPSDELIFTAKFQYADTDDEAFLQIGADSIELDGATATITVVASDWSDPPITRDRPFVWDVQLAVGGDPDQIVTIDRGTGLLKADATLTVPIS